MIKVTMKKHFFIHTNNGLYLTRLKKIAIRIGGNGFLFRIGNTSDANFCFKYYNGVLSIDFNTDAFINRFGFNHRDFYIL